MTRLLSDVTDHVRNQEISGKVADFATIAALMMQAETSRDAAEIISRSSRPFSRIVESIVKAAVGSTSLNEAQGFAGLQAAFIESLRWSSLFDAMLPSMTRVSMQPGRILGLTAALAAYSTAEGAPKPVTNAELYGEGLTRAKAQALIVVDNGQLERALQGTVDFLARQLRNAVGKATDVAFLGDVITDESPPALTSTDPLADLAALLGAVTIGSDSILFLAVSPDVAVRLTTVAETGTGRLFPLMGPTGGTVANMPAIVTEGLAAGTMALLDASGFVGATDDAMRLDIATHAALKMDNDPASGPGNLVSLWQVNASGILAERGFGWHLVRESAVAVISGIAWGEE